MSTMDFNQGDRPQPARGTDIAGDEAHSILHRTTGFVMLSVQWLIYLLQNKLTSVLYLPQPLVIHASSC